MPRGLTPRSSSSWRSSAGRITAFSSSVASTSGRRSPPTPMADHVQGGLDGDRVGGHGQRLVEVAQAGLDLGAVLGLVDHPPHLAAHQVRGHEDAAACRRVSITLREHVVVAGQQVEPVDRGHVLVAGLLDGAHVVDLSQLGEQVVGHVDHRATGDVVDDHRPVGGRRHGLEVGLDAAPVGLVVVGGDHQHGAHADLGGTLGELDRVARVVGAGARDDRVPSRALAHGELPEPALLVVGKRGRLAGAAGQHEAVGAVLEQVVHQPCRGVLVERPVRVERGDHRGEDAAEDHVVGAAEALRHCWSGLNGSGLALVSASPAGAGGAGGGGGAGSAASAAARRPARAPALPEARAPRERRVRWARPGWRRRER